MYSSYQSAKRGLRRSAIPCSSYPQHPQNCNLAAKARRQAASARIPRAGGASRVLNRMLVAVLLRLRVELAVSMSRTSCSVTIKRCCWLDPSHWASGFWQEAEAISRRAIAWTRIRYQNGRLDRRSSACMPCEALLIDCRSHGRSLAR